MLDLPRLHAFLRTTAAPGRSVVAIGPFTAYLHPTDPLKYLNYAIPDRDADPDAVSIERLREEFRSHQRLPRLEWLEEIAPRLATALAAQGLEEELRAPLMVCRPDELLVANPDVAGLAVNTVEDADLRECVDLQRVAFGQAPLGDGEQPRDPRESGGGAVLGRVEREPVAAAQWTQVHDGVSEIVGVATAEPWRGRRLAGVVTAAAARRAFDAGASICILSPGNDAAQRVYARAGFCRAATMLHWSDPE